MARKRGADYVDNKLFSAELHKYAEACRKSIGKGGERVQMNRYLGECMLKIANRLARRPNFAMYTYREEMVLDAIELCMRYSYRFDGNKYNNGFAYISQIMFSAMVQRIKKEKKKQEIKYKLMQNQAHDMMLQGQEPTAASKFWEEMSGNKLAEIEQQNKETKEINPNRKTGVIRRTTTKRRTKAQLAAERGEKVKK